MNTATAPPRAKAHINELVIAFQSVFGRSFLFRQERHQAFGWLFQLTKLAPTAPP